MIYEHWKQVPRTVRAWPWRFFTPKEIACRGTGRLIIVPEFLDGLDALRGNLGHSLIVLSAYRSSYHNARVGGAVFSRHLFGDAADLSIVGRVRLKMDEAAKGVGVTGFGYYKTFLHIDMGRARYWGAENWNV